MTVFRTAPEGYDRDEVDAQLDVLREQLARAVSQLDEAAVALRSAAPAAAAGSAEAVVERDALATKLQEAVAERDAVRAELDRLGSHDHPADRVGPALVPLVLPPAPPATRLVSGAVEGPTGPMSSRSLSGLTVPMRPSQKVDHPRPRVLGMPPEALVALGAAAALALVSFAGLRAVGDEPVPPAAAAPVAASPVAAAAPVAPATVSAPASVPAGWKPYRAPDGSYALALPPGWRSSGPNRFVSESGLTTLTVRSGPLSAAPSRTSVGADERAFAASQPGYRRLAVRELPYKGATAAVWDFRYGRGVTAQQVSDLAVLAGDTGYGLRLQARASVWEFAAPLRDGIRTSFTAPGLAR